MCNTINNFRFFLFTLFLLSISSSVFCQNLGLKKYWIEFNDKKNTPYSTLHPEKFLSLQSIARKKKYNIPILENDLPVNPSYLSQIKKTGASILYTSKWFNAAIVQIEDSTAIEKINNLPFVKKAQAVARIQSEADELKIKKTEYVSKNQKTQKKATENKTLSIADTLFYGRSYHQLDMLNAPILHRYGFTGKGMNVAILDGGFINVDKNPVFTKTFAEKRVIETFDFVQHDDSVYESSTHGANVFAILGGNLPGFYVGACPDANFYLYKTEDVDSETLIEECFWAVAAEHADSIGIDVINSSLGYSEFDYPEMNYSYQQMNGDIAISTRAADIAASKGILVVVSAGNQGNKPWHYINAPADADSILAIAAIDSLQNKAAFSSFGPSSDNNVKPNIAAQGQNTVYVNTGGYIASGNGTSYSSPIIAGLVACLWQANTNKTNMEIIDAVQKSASQYSSPDSLLGYGIPDFYKALQQIATDPIFRIDTTTPAFVFPNPFNNETGIYFYAKFDETVTLNLFDIGGRKLDSVKHEVRKELPYKLQFNNISKYPKGVYIIKIDSRSQQKSLIAVKTSN